LGLSTPLSGRLAEPDLTHCTLVASMYAVNFRGHEGISTRPRPDP